jgi:predicted nucleotidyltransferase
LNLFIESHQTWLKKLLSANVDFIIVGGYSVIFHGYKRTTGDIDVWLKPTNENKEKLLSVLTEEFDEDDVQQIATLDFTKHMVFSIGDEPEKIDFLTFINQVSYDEAEELKIIADIDDLKIPFIHLNHLVLSKFNTGRLKDKADIEMLQKIDRTVK